MIPLSNGQIVGISNIRARYHALRLSRNIDDSTSHHELYDLIDIVENPEKSDDIPYHYHPRFRFTGHTLAELANISSWSIEDIRIFSEWLSQENQIQLIEQTRKRIFSDELPLVEQHYEHPENLYSSLEQKIQALPLRRASIAQWRKTLLNMRQQGIRDEEINWSGLLPYLTRCEENKKSFITKQELLSTIDFSAIRLSLTNELASKEGSKLDFIEVSQSQIQNAFHSARIIALPDEVCVIRYVEPMHYYKVGFIKQLRLNGREQSQNQWFVLDTIGNPVMNSISNEPRYESKLEAFNAASRHALQHVGVPVEYSPCQRYEHKTLCGGEDYREWLVTLPDYPISHFTSHYQARNLLLHFRTKKRIDTQDRKLLFIEEIQSDWHQSGAMHGYQNRWPGSIPPAPFRKEWIGLSLKFILQEAAKSDFDGIAWTSGKVQESHYSKKMGPIIRLYDEEIPRYLKRLCRPWCLKIKTCHILTKEPRLHISRERGKWCVTDKNGTFSTRPRYSQKEAIQVMARHCKQIELEVPVLFFDQAIKRTILNKGFPIFGEQTDIF